MVDQIKTLVCVDLEETIIDNIWEGNLLPANIHKIKQIIKQEAPDKIETFSWALIDQPDFEMWVTVQQEISFAGLFIDTQEFKVRSLQMEFLKNKFKTHKLPHEDSALFLSEFCTFCQKELVFEWWALHQPFTNFTLIDDMVQDKTVICQGKTIKFIKI